MMRRWQNDGRQNDGRQNDGRRNDEEGGSSGLELLMAIAASSWPMKSFLRAGYLLSATVVLGTMGQAASFTEPVGLQLYSLRADFTRNVPATLEKVRGFGIKQVELAG